MSGRGIRHRRQPEGITISKESARRLVRQAGVARVDAEIIAKPGQGGSGGKGKMGKGVVHALFRNFIYTIGKDALVFTDYRRGKMVSGKDVLYALKRHNMGVHGAE